ncbi:hypothetical protein [Anabaena azotica]|uniref:Uncharacterized protein n=1 Tax=Anabaena azotica FACHB-119 TaxID=947527 RepID=A0ABR8D7J8_9NOST|nr:hypothetical protein [Anabaena azotica]MBD2503132.1 hypothetical protein [Anabaena azotica FACHB-119]
MTFDNYSFSVGYPVVNGIDVNTPDFSVGIVFIFNNLAISSQVLVNGVPLIPGSVINIYPFLDRLTYFQAIWGSNASQNASELNIKKTELPDLTSKLTNSSTSLLLGVINRLLINFPTNASVPVEAYIFSRYLDGNHEYIDIVIKCKARLSVIDGYEIQYFNDSFDPDNFT